MVLIIENEEEMTDIDREKTEILRSELSGRSFAHSCSIRVAGRSMKPREFRLIFILADCREIELSLGILTIESGIGQDLEGQIR